MSRSSTTSLATSPPPDGPLPPHQSSCSPALGATLPGAISRRTSAGVLRGHEPAERHARSGCWGPPPVPGLRREAQAAETVRAPVRRGASGRRVHQMSTRNARAPTGPHRAGQPRPRRSSPRAWRPRAWLPPDCWGFDGRVHVHPLPVSGSNPVNTANHHAPARQRLSCGRASRDRRHRGRGWIPAVSASRLAAHGLRPGDRLRLLPEPRRRRQSSPRTDLHHTAGGHARTPRTRPAHSSTITSPLDIGPLRTVREFARREV